MIDRILEVVVDESKWLPFAMLVSMLAVAITAGWPRQRRLSRRLRMLWGMNLFFGCMIGIMALGHLLAVSVKAAQGTLDASGMPLTLLYPIGVVLAVPAWWLVSIVGRYPEGGWKVGKQVRTLNICLGLFLAALGLHNLPLAIPAGLNLAYQFHSRRAVGWTILAITVAGYLALFVGAVQFMLSGQSFEEFSASR
ncbi:MAG: hypothetical protein AAF560_01800 [Acidobacteriota bacterium]